jgi:hypothetical protein
VRVDGETEVTVVMTREMLTVDFALSHTSNSVET